ncbi:hypothetical protein TVAG_097720 [Trichomonas vaginalis G3]|uniref:Phosphoprotein phosphatase n=1 Tax=Trichomonas vaginalis (strain ATCC PRA-98 / G3) TaxID=412133 RepID=A2E2A2_TRIV3|nr:protein phosphatase regulator protein [Trichomonas vaginalis G3]EAY13202.1 hypothetical protein TVAG_097720 [Trichomonas vaginalis G3]KAI5488172.1 protein phosphatase regulator protein [Trichomonas vaginalis G3]|eukprot:XP_001325425.1 hypothetical protein [Trichomonas vaginalis G3]
MISARYKSNKKSRLSCKKIESISATLSQLAYHTTNQQVLKPITDYNDSTTPKGDEPIADEGVPNALYTVEVTKHIYHTNVQFEKLPSLGDRITANNLDLLIKKCQQCCVLCDFSDNESDVSAKPLKTNTLKEIGDALANSSPDYLTDEAFNAIYGMITANLTRCIPSIPKKYMWYDDEPLIFDINWPHLQLVYVILFNTIKLNTTDKRLHDMRKTILTIINSADPNERDQIFQFYMEYLKNFPDQFESLFNDLSYKLIEYMEGDLPFCVTPILRLYHEQLKIVKLTDYMARFWNTDIIPLISCQHILTVYPPMMDIAETIYTMDPDIPKKTLRVMFHHWPESRPSKQISYLILMNFLIEQLNAEDFGYMCVPIFKLYSRLAMSTLHAKVTEATFRIWSNLKILQIITDNTQAIYPVVYPVYQKIMKDHWRASTKSAALNAMKAMHDLDPFVFDEIAQSKKEKTDDDGVSDATIHKSWASIARSAAKNEKSLNLARVLADIQLNFNKSDPLKDMKKMGKPSLQR